MSTFRYSAVGALITFASLTFASCAKDPHDPQTWIDKLDDTKELENAVSELERLKCPVAIKHLGKVWKKHNKWSRALEVMIKIADQPDAKPGNPKYPNQDCPNAGEGPYWKDAIPILVEAVENFDVTDEREVEDARAAAEALGRAKSPEGIQALITVATKKETLRQGQRARIAAVRALGAFGNDARALDTIIRILQAEAKVETIRLNAAAANALAETRSPKAILPLLTALFEVPPIYQQVRTALTTIGKPVVPELIKIFNGTHAEINKLAAKHNFATDCEKGEGPGTTCVAPGNLRFKAATLLGDMRATEAIPALTKALSKPEAVSFFDPKTGAPGPSDHTAILDALRNMGATSAADEVSTYMQSESTNDVIRPLAVDVYSMLAKDTKALGFLQKTFEDQDNEMPLRQAATLAYSRLVTSDKQLEPIQEIIDRQLKSAKEADQKAAKAKQADKKKEAEGTANDFRAFAREYEQHRTRARTGIVCKGKLDCYRELLKMSPQQIEEKLKIPRHQKNQAEASRKYLEGYRIAALERALLDIAKMGKKGAPALDDLLKLAESTDRIVRQGVLLALIQAAPSPCDQCATRLNEIIASQSSQSTLGYLTADTRIILNYFVANGAKLADGAALAPESEEAPQ